MERSWLGNSAFLACRSLPGSCMYCSCCYVRRLRCTWFRRCCPKGFRSTCWIHLLRLLTPLLPLPSVPVADSDWLGYCLAFSIPLCECSRPYQKVYLPKLHRLSCRYHFLTLQLWSCIESRLILEACSWVRHWLIDL